jgi:hypothetical protein
MDDMRFGQAATTPGGGSVTEHVDSTEETVHEWPAGRRQDVPETRKIRDGKLERDGDKNRRDDATPARLGEMKPVKRNVGAG